MAQAVTSRFANAQVADANKPATKVQLVLGNYCNAAAYGSSAVASSTLSANYPANGAIDGDRTEINIGPASGADNDIGASSWQSSVAPDTTPQSLEVDFNATRTINRLKLYHLNGSGLKTFYFQYWNGSSWVTFAATADIVTGTQVSITSTHQLDTVDFNDITTTKIRLFINHTVVAAGMANVVELESYRLIDISDRVKAVNVSRRRDYKLDNPMAASVSIGCINTDRYFSMNHTPTTDEATAGFVNSELQPGVGLIVQMGFDYYGNRPEMVTTFTGEIDRISINPAMRDATIDGRDLMKRLINKIDSTKLKSGKDVAANIQYVLNRANISNYEMSLDQTGINIDYFFTDQQSQLDTIRDLAQSPGDTIFFISELGIPTFRDYTGVISNQHLYTSEIDWEAGILANISTLGIYAGQLAVPRQFIPALADGVLTGDMQISGGQLTLPASAAYTGDQFHLGGGTMRQFGVGFGPNPFTNNDAIYQPYVIPRAGTINSLTIGGWEVGTVFGGVPLKIEIMSDSSGTPFQDGGVVYSTNVPGDQLTPVTVNPNVHVAAGVYWVAISSYPPGGTTIAQAVLAEATDGHQARAVAGTYSLLTFTTHEKAGLVSGFTFTYDVVPKSGTWTSPWYDSYSLAVNLNPTIAQAATYLAGNSSTTYLKGSDDGATVAVTYSTSNLNGNWTPVIAQHRYWQIEIDASCTDNTTVPLISSPTLLFAPTGTWTTPILDTGSNTIGFGSITDTRVLNGGTITYYTSSSPDGVSWEGYMVVSPSGQILSTLARYLKVQVVIGLGPGGVTPIILDITVGWTSGAGSKKYPTTSSFTFSFDSSLLDVQQELADNLGGDTSILNDIIVQAQPLVLTGADADTVWQGTIGTPPSDISAGTPMTVVAGQIIVISPVISGGMDITNMAGGTALALTFGGGASGVFAFTRIHPTLPQVTISVTVGGTITDLRIIGKTFQNASYLQAQVAQDATSIAKYGDRQFSLTNPFITATSVASSIAAALLSNFKNPTSYIPSARVSFCPALQIGDRVTVNDVNLDLTADYIAVGMDHKISVSESDASIETDVVLLKVPAGS